ncbi:LysR family transcriptional regulator [Vibrio mediterranei]|jgi:DNA-binding transcriptional LysR family regulator|uniref:LysR family transcriptional regulator n=1 Tax=Vibrio mediterranei TaxID=689 RepID=UPI0022842873|nr:LysR family transcriptional regulator [Vibrio mediterranei]MCY9855281.1 LysR family transcriptional regulator [Vibrio mediterranei]
MDKFDNMRVFNTIVERQGLTAAARLLNTSPASITTKLKALEQHYGVKLLNRTTRSISLTEEGKKFYHLSKNALSHISHLEEEFQSKTEQLSGNLRISAPRDLGQSIINPLIDDFVNLNPKIVPHLILSDDILSIQRYQLDITFRYSHLEDSQLIARKIYPSRRVLCASPAYLDKYGCPSHPYDLTYHLCIGSQQNKGEVLRWYFTIEGKRRPIDIEPIRFSNDGSILKAWALAGHGIALKSMLDIQNEVHEGKLEVIMESYKPDFTLSGKNAELHLIYPHRDFLPNRTRAFIHFAIGYFDNLI